MNAGTMCIVYYACARKQLQYYKVDAVEQRNTINSGVRGKKDWDLRTEMGSIIRALCCIVTIIRPIILLYISGFHSSAGLLTVP